MNFPNLFEKLCDIYPASVRVGVCGKGAFFHADLPEFADTTLRGWIPNAHAAGKALKVHVLQSPSTFSTSCLLPLTLLFTVEKKTKSEPKIWSACQTAAYWQLFCFSGMSYQFRSLSHFSQLHVLAWPKTNNLLTLIHVLCCGFLLCRIGM